MSRLSLRVKARSGNFVVSQLTSDSTFDELKSTISELTQLPSWSLRILHGFPPKPISVTDGHSSLGSMNFKSGDTLIVEEDPTAKAEAEAKKTEALLQEIQCQNDNVQGILTRRVVPANNSCLFTSLDYVLEGRMEVNLASAKPMRKLIAQFVKGDPEMYNEAVLGRSNSSYCSWIQKEDSWGGAIELAILSKHYGIEMDVVDTQSGRIDRFGEDQDYARRVLVIYDGIHYDPLVLESLDPHNPSLSGIFPTSNVNVLLQAQEIANEAKQSKQFTDVNQFTLRCLICQKSLTGQAEAQVHAKKTGHINFGEY